MNAKLKDIKERFESVKEADFQFQFLDTQFSLTILITDKNAFFEEIYHIDKSDENEEQVHCVTEGDKYVRMSLDTFHTIVKDNW